MGERSGDKFAGEVHVFPIRVYYEDTDSGGVVYYANYLKFAERARTELLRGMGFLHPELSATDGIAFAVRKCVAEFLVPAQLDDLLHVYTRFVDAAGASFKMDQTIRRNGEDLVNINTRLACVSSAGRPARIPGRIRAEFENFTKEQERSS